MDFHENEKVSIEAAGHLFKKIGDHNPKTIAKALLNGKSHPLVKLESLNLGDEGLIPISNAIEQQAIISSLDLSNNNLTAKGIKSLSESLSQNSHVHYLKLDNNSFGDDGAFHLAKLIKTGKKCQLKSIYLSECQITSKGVQYLVESILQSQYKCQIETIHLNSNLIGNDGSNYLCKLISNSVGNGNNGSKCKNISICFCGIGDSGASSILSKLESTISTGSVEDLNIININLKGNKINSDIMVKLNKILSAKKKLEDNKKIKLLAQSLIIQEAESLLQKKMITVQEQSDKKLNDQIKSIDQESKKTIEEQIKTLNEESKKKFEEKIKFINEESKKKLTERMKTIQSKEDNLNSQMKEIAKSKKDDNSGNEKSKSKSKSSSKKKSSTTSLSNNGESIIIVIAGDKVKDKDQFIDHCMGAMNDCKIEAENDFEKIFSGTINVDNKLVGFRFVNTSSDDRYSRLRALQYEQADAAVIAFTTNDRVSFEDIPFQWIPEIQFMGKIPIYITGMSSDKRSQPPKLTDVNEKEGREASIKFGASNYFEPISSDDIKSIASIVYRDIKKKKK